MIVILSVAAAMGVVAAGLGYVAGEVIEDTRQIRALERAIRERETVR